MPLFPAVFGPMVLGRIAIGVWLLIFGALGVALMRADVVEAPARDGRRSSAPTEVLR